MSISCGCVFGNNQYMFGPSGFGNQFFLFTGKNNCREYKNPFNGIHGSVHLAIDLWIFSLSIIHSNGKIQSIEPLRSKLEQRKKLACCAPYFIYRCSDHWLMCSRSIRPTIPDGVSAYLINSKLRFWPQNLYLVIKPLTLEISKRASILLNI